MLQTIFLSKICLCRFVGHQKSLLNITKYLPTPWLLGNSDNIYSRYYTVYVRVAVNTSKGLITPIIFGADRKGLKSISQDVRSVAVKDNHGKLKPAEFQVTKDDNICTDSDPTLWQKILKKLDFIGISRSKLKFASYRLYSCCTDNVNHQDFFTHFSMQDTFNSWFLVTELHVWLASVRVMQEGKNGRLCRFDVVEAMWKDVEERSKVLATIDSGLRRTYINELGSQFRAAVISYDEGLLSNDRVLAGALWRRFFQRKCDNVEKLELLLDYIRRTVTYLDSLQAGLFLSKGKITWLPLVEDKR